MSNEKKLSVGEKVKRLREEHGLTQSQVCEGFMTRNMLSRIEHDAALPSVSTIRSLADRFGIDPGYFLSDSDDILLFRKITIIDNLRECFTQKKYAECLDFSVMFPDPDCELCFYFFESSLHLGENLYRSGDFNGALVYYERCKFYAGKTFFTSTLYEAVEFCEGLCLDAINKKAFDYTVPHGNGYFTKLYEISMYELLLRLIHQNKNELAAQVYDSVKLSNPLFKKHINARLSMASGNFTRAVTLLGEIIECFDENSDRLFEYTVYADMEKSCKTAGDYEGAYKSTVAKTAISEGFISNKSGMSENIPDGDSRQNR